MILRQEYVMTYEGDHGIRKLSSAALPLARMLPRGEQDQLASWGGVMAYRFDSWDCLLQLSCRSATQQQHLLAQATPTPSPPGTPLVNVAGTSALVFIGVLALAVAILWFIPTLYDLRKANQWRSTEQSELLKDMVKAAAREKGLSVEDVRQIASAMNAPPRGVQGLTQALLGLIITTLVGVAMVATLVSTAADSSDLRKTIITALLSILGTIAGFYFGARTAQISSEQATRPPTPTSGPATGQNAPPTVTDVSPKSGPVTGGTKVTMTGTGFTGATGVNFGPVAGQNLAVASDTQLTVTSPPATASGPVDVTVTTPAGTSTTSSADHFTYNSAAAAPTVTAINPDRGPVAGGTNVTVTGTGFTGATGVNFGQVAVQNLAVASDTQLTVTSPPATAAGTVGVTVTTPAGTSPTSPADQFIYD